MSPNPEEKEVVDPLKNLEKLFLQIVEFILTNIQIIVVVLALIFILVIMLLLIFFNLLGF